MGAAQNLDNFIPEDSLRTMQGDLKHLRFLQQKKEKAVKTKKQLPAQKPLKKLARPAKQAAAKPAPRKKASPKVQSSRSWEKFLAGLAVMVILISTGYAWFVFDLTSFVTQQLGPVFEQAQQLVGRPSAPMPEQPTEPKQPILPVSPALFPVDKQMVVTLGAATTGSNFAVNFQSMAQKVQAEPGDFVRLIVKKDGHELNLDEFLLVFGLEAPEQVNQFLTGQYTAFWYADDQGLARLGLVAKLKQPGQVENFPSIVPAFRNWEPELAGGLGQRLLGDSPLSATQFKTIIANIQLLYRTQLLEGQRSFGYALVFQKGWLIISDSSGSLVKLVGILF